MSSRILAPWIVLLLPALSPDPQQARFPEPEFESGYRLPEVTQPSPRSPTMEIADLTVLGAALALSTWFALRLRSRRALFLLTVASLLYFGFWREGCVCAVGAIQNLALALCNPDYAVPLTTVAIFLLPLLFALMFGRVYCGAVCPLGAAQDIVILKPIRVPPALARFLLILPPLYLGLAVLGAATGADFLICRYDPFVGFFRLGANLDLFLWGAALLLLGTVVARPYCRFLCPYGLLLSWMSRLSRRHLTVTPTVCTRCRLCEDSCPIDALRRPSPEHEAEPRRTGIFRLVLLLGLLPLLVAGGAGLGLLVHAPLSRWHATVRLAEQVLLEKTGRTAETTLESRTFHESERPLEELLRRARLLRGRFRTGSALLGAFLGLSVGGALLRHSIRRTRTGYEPDRGACLSCGRCIPFCPVERQPEALETKG